MFDDLANKSYLSNEAALSELKKSCERFENISSSFVPILTGLVATGFPGMLMLWVLMIPMGVTLNRMWKTYRLKEVTEALLQEFGDDAIIIPKVPVPGKPSIDLFVRFPGRVLLLMSIRSKGKRKVVFNEKNKTLCIKGKHRRGGLLKWKPDPLAELASYEYWLKKNRRELGLSSRESNRPIAKVLALAGETDIEVHKEHLYIQTGDKKFLWVKTKGTAAVIRKQEVVDFTKAYLAQEEQKKLQKANSR